MDLLLQKLQQHKKITNDECFDLATYITTLINATDELSKQNGRNVLILMLDNWHNISESYKGILIDIIEAAGFYPYLEKMQISLGDLDAEIRLAYHKSANVENRYFHSKQKEIADLIKKHVNVIVSAPTSFGKSLLIEEIVASHQYHDIVIIQPTLALLDETRRKLKKHCDFYKIIVKTTQAVSDIKGNIFLLTAERVLEYPNMPDIQLLVLDEFYKLSNQRGDNRSNILNTAFIRIMRNPYCRFYMLGPNIDSIPEGFTQEYNAVFYKTDFSMVLTEEDNRYDAVSVRRGNKVVEDDIFGVLDELKEQTLIYCSSPSTARKLAFGYCAHLTENGVVCIPDLPLVAWINDNLSYKWSLAKCLQYEIAVHDGAMPKHITSSTIHYFNENKIRYLFCTNTIIEGVNTSAKNVIYYDNKIGKRKIDYFDYSNIRGRAGRLMEHFVGKIINLKKPPQAAITKVDFPFYEQNPVSSEVLVNLDENDVKNINDNLARYSAFKAQDPELQEILKRNGVSIEGQQQLLKILMADLAVPSKRRLIIWSGIDSSLYERLTYIFNLCWKNLSTEDERKSFGSQGWVVYKIVRSCHRTSIAQMIDNDIEYEAKKLAEEKGVAYTTVEAIFLAYPVEIQERVDTVIEKLFALQKNWLQYRAPKWINVVNSLQKYATFKLGLASGDYSYVAEMIENEFIQSGLRILLEYGVPRSAIQKIQVIMQTHGINISQISEDKAIEIINAHVDDFKEHLIDYEIDILNRAF